MKLRCRIAGAITLGMIALSLGSQAGAAQLKENTADIKQDINIPGMAIVINPGGIGCNQAIHEKWEPSEGGCSNIEYRRENARVIKVEPSQSSMSVAVSSPSLVTATVSTTDGIPVGPGIPVTWTATLGGLSTYSGVTNAASQMSVTLSSPKGSPVGMNTIAAYAKAGGASTGVNVYNSAKVAGLKAVPPTVEADGSSYSTLVASLIYENGASVGAGENLSWASNLGNYLYAESSTNINGQAIAYLASGTAGVASPQAIRNTAAATSVTFTSSKPVINSFTSRCTANPSKGWQSNCFFVDLDRVYYQWNEFSWGATGADRYELVNPWGEILYSGSGTSVSFSNKPFPDFWRSKTWQNGSDGSWWPYTLKAYKGNNVATVNLQIQLLFLTCSSCGSN